MPTTAKQVNNNNNNTNNTNMSFPGYRGSHRSEKLKQFQKSLDMCNKVAKSDTYEQEKAAKKRASQDTINNIHATVTHPRKSHHEPNQEVSEHYLNTEKGKSDLEFVSLDKIDTASDKLANAGCVCIPDTNARVVAAPKQVRILFKKLYNMHSQRIDALRHQWKCQNEKEQAENKADAQLQKYINDNGSISSDSSVSSMSSSGSDPSWCPEGMNTRQPKMKKRQVGHKRREAKKALEEKQKAMKKDKEASQQKPEFKYTELKNTHCSLTIMPLDAKGVQGWDRYWLFPTGYSDLKYLVGLLHHCEINKLLSRIGKSCMRVDNPIILSCSLYLNGPIWGEVWPVFHIDGCEDQEDKVYTCIIPIILQDGSPEEFYLQSKSNAKKMFLYKYCNDQALVFTQSTWHNTARFRKAVWSSTEDLRVCLFLTLSHPDVLENEMWRKQILSLITPCFPYPQTSKMPDVLSEEPPDEAWIHYVANWAKDHNKAKDDFDPRPTKVRLKK